jgi:NAD(P)-dependent dehydrogenase (short-subunit alcohol dehydrogenase family)
VNVHFKGVYFLTQKLLPLIKDGGHIVNISSGLALRYRALRLMEPPKARWRCSRVTWPKNSDRGASPQMSSLRVPVRDNPEINKRVAEMTALGRAGVPDDIGPMIAAFLSDENRWVNGQRIEVSGGMAL